MVCATAIAQVTIDISADAARKAAGIIYLEDLAVHDIALIYENFCVKDGGLYVPGWTIPANLAADTYTASGLILRIEIMPGRKIKGTWVDAAKAQRIAKGNTDTTDVLSKENYNQAVRRAISRIFDGGYFGVNSCDEIQRENALRPLTVYPLESINGFTKLSDLLASVTKK
jgi:hypothetical protein